MKELHISIRMMIDEKDNPKVIKEMLEDELGIMSTLVIVTIEEGE